MIPDFVDRPLVYVAGPYSHPDPVTNTARAVETAEWITAEYEVTALVPHLTLLWHFHEPHPVDWWYRYDLALLARCDALYRILGPSEGADDEVAFAVERGMPVLRTDYQLCLWLNELTETPA